MGTIEATLQANGLSDPNYLEQYGVRGMKWGVRKRDGSGGASSGPEEVTVTSRPGRGAVASGGRNHPPSEEAKLAVAYRQKARASSVHSLNNAELKLLVERLNLENNYAKLTAADRAPSKRKAFLQKLLREEGGAFVKGQKGPRTQLIEMIIKNGQGLAYQGARAAPAYVGKRRG